MSKLSHSNNHSVSSSKIKVSITQLGSNIRGHTNGDRFGTDLAISADGNMLAISAPTYRRNNASVGQVRIYQLELGSWKLIGELYGLTDGEGFGASISFSHDGNVLTIGATHSNHDHKINAGRVEVFVWDGTSWGKRGPAIQGKNDREQLGNVVSLSADGTRLAISGSWANVHASSQAGLVRIYDWDGIDWVQAGSDLMGKMPFDNFGMHMTLASDGKRIAIRNRGSAGMISVYDWDGNNWEQLGPVIQGVNSGGLHDKSSLSFSHDGTLLAIGETHAYNQYGRVRVLKWNGISWIQQGEEIVGTVLYNHEGYFVTLSSDGKRLATSAKRHEHETGRVRLFSWNGEDWIQTDQFIKGESNDEVVGDALSLSANGDRIAISSINTSNSTGLVSVFTID